MGKTKAISQNKKTPGLKNARSIPKKPQKRKSNKKLSNSTFKNELKKQAFHQISKDISTSKQNRNKKKKHDSTDGHVAPNVTKLEFQTKDLNSDNITTEMFQKVHPNIDSKRRYRKRNKRQKQNISSDQENNNITVATLAVKPVKKPQNIAKKTVNYEQNKTEIQNLKTNQKEIKQISINKKTQVKSRNTLKRNNCKIKLERLKEMLIKKTQTKQLVQKIKKEQPLTLRDRMMAQLNASRFRFINETLYNSDSSQSKQYFKEDPDAFKAYHDGYKQQIEQWPVNPLDVIMSSIKKMPTDNIIADFGCGEAQLAASVPHEVHSFDFIALNDKVKACDITHTPLLMNSVHVVVFCLSLMGTNLNDYLIEANRVLKINGVLKIAEVESRFENVEDFIKLVGCYGFKNTWKDLSYDLFYFMDFKKQEDINMKKKILPTITLKPCMYKKR